MSRPSVGPTRRGSVRRSGPAQGPARKAPSGNQGSLRPARPSPGLRPHPAPGSRPLRVHRTRGPRCAPHPSRQGPLSVPVYCSRRHTTTLSARRQQIALPSSSLGERQPFAAAHERRPQQGRVQARRLMLPPALILRAAQTARRTASGQASAPGRVPRSATSRDPSLDPASSLAQRPPDNPSPVKCCRAVPRMPPPPGTPSDRAASPGETLLPRITRSKQIGITAGAPSAWSRHCPRSCPADRTVGVPGGSLIAHPRPRLPGSDHPSRPSPRLFPSFAPSRLRVRHPPGART